MKPEDMLDMDSERITGYKISGLPKTQGKGTGQTGKHRIPHIILHGQPHKSCCRCGCLKPLDQFNTKNSHWDGKDSCCKSCC